jgi:hypothetical protein
MGSQCAGKTGLSARLRLTLEWPPSSTSDSDSTSPSPIPQPPTPLLLLPVFDAFLECDPVAFRLGGRSLSLLMEVSSRQLIDSPGARGGGEAERKKSRKRRGARAFDGNAALDKGGQTRLLISDEPPSLASTVESVILRDVSGVAAEAVSRSWLSEGGGEGKRRGICRRQEEEQQEEGFFQCGVRLGFIFGCFQARCFRCCLVGMAQGNEYQR